MRRAMVEFGEMGTLGVQVLLPLPPDGLHKPMSGTYTSGGTLADYTIP